MAANDAKTAREQLAQNGVFSKSLLKAVEAAAIPLTYVTAWYSLCHLARIDRDVQYRLFFDGDLTPLVEQVLADWRAGDAQVVATLGSDHVLMKDVGAGGIAPRQRHQPAIDQHGQAVGRLIRAEPREIELRRNGGERIPDFTQRRQR